MGSSGVATSRLGTRNTVNTLSVQNGSQNADATFTAGTSVTDPLTTTSGLYISPNPESAAWSSSYCAIIRPAFPDSTGPVAQLKVGSTVSYAAGFKWLPGALATSPAAAGSANTTLTFTFTESSGAQRLAATLVVLATMTLGF
jgi:hypothetical protein